MSLRPTSSSGARRWLRLVAAALIAVAVSCVVSAQNLSPVESCPDEPEVPVKAFRGYYHDVDEYGDTCRYTIFNVFYVYSDLKFKNKKEEEFYWKLVRDVKKTLPYAKFAFNTLCETYEYILTLPDQKTRDAHLKTLEKDIFNRYKPAIKSMTKSQGKVLLKLIGRETNQSSYNIVKAFLGSFRAGFWQTFGRFFGMNLKVDFTPEKDKTDALIERIAILIEQGSLK